MDTAPLKRVDELFTKIGSTHLRAVEQLGTRPADDDTAVLDDVATVRTLQGDLHVLLDQQEAEAPVPMNGVDRAHEVVHDDGRQTKRHLVDEEDVGTRHEPAPDGAHLLLATR